MRIIRRIARLFMLPLLKNGVFFVTMYILGILCAYLTLPDNDNAEVYDNLGLELFLDLYAGCVVLALLPRKVRLWVRRCLYLILYGVAITDVFCFWKFGSVITPSMLMLVGETDSREAGEFFSTYLSSDVLTSPVMWIVLLILAHVVIGLRKPVCRLLGIDYRKFRHSSTSVSSDSFIVTCSIRSVACSSWRCSCGAASRAGTTRKGWYN